MVMGSPISKKFKAVFASSFCYDHNGVAIWPAQAINYTSKTQYLFRINKGCLDVHKHDGINKYVPEEDRQVPFRNMIYIGDGDTDIPCFRLVRDRGGYAIAVFKPRTKGAKRRCDQLAKEGRVTFVAPADYTNESDIDKIVKALIDKIAGDYHLNELKPTTVARAKENLHRAVNAVPVHPVVEKNLPHQDVDGGRDAHVPA